MVSNKTFIGETCGYSTNRKYNLELHRRSPNACERRLKRQHKIEPTQNVSPLVSLPVQNVSPLVSPPTQNVSPPTQNVSPIIIIKHCSKCSKMFNRNSDLLRHEKTCNGLHSLQCPTCKYKFTCASSKSRHIRLGNCEFLLTEEQQRIKDLEEILEQKEQQLEEEKQKRKEAEDSKATVNNINITNNYFDHSINYNNYDNLNLDHITKEDIKRLFNNCRMQYPELSEDLTRMILGPKENQCIYLPEGQKSNTCAVIKDGVEMRKPLIRVLMDLGVQTATLIRDSNVIVRNKKDVVNNQFWADNRNACGLNISDIEYMTENDKEIVQRNKNIVLDMSDGKI